MKLVWHSSRLGCKTSPDYRWGEAIEESLVDETVPLRRLTFNPYYAEMLEELEDFLQQTESL